MTTANANLAAETFAERERLATLLAALGGGLDITEPLGLPGPPAHRIAQVLNHAGPRNLQYFGVDLQGVRLTAADADVTVGQGTTETRTMPVKDMLLVVTGRVAVTEVGGLS